MVYREKLFGVMYHDNRLLSSDFKSFIIKIYNEYAEIIKQKSNEKVELHPDALKRIKKCRAMLEKKIEAGLGQTVVYTSSAVGNLG